MDTVEDKGSVGFGILSFFLPIVGIPLFFAWKKDHPKKARSCIIGSIISIALVVISGIAGSMGGSKSTPTPAVASSVSSEPEAVAAKEPEISPLPIEKEKLLPFDTISDIFIKTATEYHYCIIKVDPFKNRPDMEIPLFNLYYRGDDMFEYDLYGKETDAAFLFTDENLWGIGEIYDCTAEKDLKKLAEEMLSLVRINSR
jgi:hypothetical protein